MDDKNWTFREIEAEERNEIENAFMKEISDVMKKYNASFDITCETTGWDSTVANMEFDIHGVSYNNKIVGDISGSFDFDHEYIDKIIAKKNNSTS